MTKRLNKLRSILKKKKLGAVLISQPPNIRYLCGFDGTFGYLLITPKDVILVTSFIYIEQAKKQSYGCRLLEVKKRTSNWLPSLLKESNIKKLGFEKEHLSYEGYLTLEKSVSRTGTILIPLSRAVEQIRQQKEESEISYIQEAVNIADTAFAHLLNINLVGMTELEVAWEVESYMRQHGSQELPFPVIVASGPNSALPHASPTSRIIKEGEPLLFDYGARVNGYASDFTRTICPGKGNVIFAEIYSIVLKAQLAVISEARSGMSGREIDEIARKIINEAGYGKNYGHGLGHGLGLEVHEPPHIGPLSKDIIEDGMAFTIEPGIYLPEWGGVRIEDTVSMDCGKIKLLSQADK
jgi:Xaa-Pro aminopeptidase